MKYSPLILLVAVGCAVGDDDALDVETKARQDLSWARGIVSIDYDVRSDEVDVDAHFFDAINIEPHAAFDALEVWRPDWEMDLDHCVMASDSTQASEHKLRLINVDELSVEVADEVHTLEQRRLPDVITGVSGVVYGTAEGFDIEAIRIPYVADEIYSVHARGSEEASSFETFVRAPKIAVLESINGISRPHVTGFVETNGDLEFAWEGGPTDSKWNDDVWLVLKSGAQFLGHCRLANDGSFLVPDRMLPSDIPITFELRTARSTTIEVEGFGPTEVVLSAADRIQVGGR